MLTFWCVNVEKLCSQFSVFLSIVFLILFLNCWSPWKVVLFANNPNRSCWRILQLFCMWVGFHMDSMRRRWKVLMVFVFWSLDDFLGVCVYNLLFVGYIGQFRTIKKLRIARNKRVCGILVYLLPILSVLLFIQLCHCVNWWWFVTYFFLVGICDILVYTDLFTLMWLTLPIK